MRIQLDPVSFPQQQEGQVHEDPAQELELDAVGPEGQVREDPVQEPELDAGAPGGQVHEDPAQEPELDAVAPGGGEDQQQIGGGDVRRSERTGGAPDSARCESSSASS